MNGHGEIRLRPVEDADLDEFFRHMQDPEAGRMAAFIAKDPSDRAAFDEKWARIRSDSRIVVRTVLSGDTVVGHVSSFIMEGRREVTYWIDRDWWGRGIATAALRALVALHPDEELHARAASDNAASIRVLEKCGFVRTGTGRGFANARGAEIDEVVMRRDAKLPPDAGR